MKRTFCPLSFNIIGNDPDVKAAMLYDPDAVVDFTNLVVNENNHCLLTDDEDGGYLVVNQGDGRYEVHTLSLPKSRGMKMYRLMLRAIEYMFIETDCLELVTFCPDENLAAIAWAKGAGFRKTFRSRSNYLNYKGKDVQGYFCSITIDDWMVSNTRLAKEGEWFHDLLRMAQGHLDHPDDEVHDRVVGATVMAIRAGNAAKGIALYNRWAKTAGYQQSRVITANPLVVNIQSAILQLFGQEIRVLKVMEKS